MKIGVDVDGVLFDYHTATCALGEAAGLPKIDVQGLREHDLYHLPGMRDIVMDSLSDCNFYAALPPIHAGFKIAKQLLDEGIEIEFLTARLDCVGRVTIDAIRENLDDAGYTGATPKLICFGATNKKAMYVYANKFDAMVEDNPKMFDFLTELGWTKDMFFLYPQPWNIVSNYKHCRMAPVEIANVLIRRHRRNQIELDSKGRNDDADYGLFSRY